MDLGLIETLLVEEEGSPPVLDRTNLEGHRYRRAALQMQLGKLHSDVEALWNRYNSLPRLADTRHTRWAEAVLKFPNLALIALDSTGVNEDSDILRVTISSSEGITNDWFVCPQRQLGQANSSYTGIPRDTILAAPYLADTWPAITNALAGRYTLAYNLEFVRSRLRENAEHYNLEPITLIGECLMERARNYYSSSSSTRLTDICPRIGHILPRPATTIDRLAGQIAFIHAMGQGIMDIHYHPAPKARGNTNDDPGDLGDHPF